jgi:hypothetical protein
VGFIDGTLDGAGVEPLRTGDGNENPKRRRERCLGVAVEMEIKAFGKTRFGYIPFILQAVGPRPEGGRGRTCAVCGPTHQGHKFR